MVLKQCKSQDGITESDKFNVHKHAHCKNLVDFMHSHNIQYSSFSTDKSSIQDKSLTGIELMRFIENVDVTSLLPSYAFRHHVQWLLDNFYVIYIDLKTEDVSASFIRKQTRSWIRVASM
jgi:hypothetical protein